MCPAKPDAPRRLGVLAGSGSFPREVAEACAAQGQDIFIVDLEGRAGEWAQAFETKRFSLGQVGGALAALREAGCDAVVMAGAVDRPSAASLKTDWTGLKLMPRIIRAVATGDDGLLRAVAAFLEEQGLRVLAPHTFLGERALAPAGFVAGPVLSVAAEAEIKLGREVLGVLSQFDIGQAAVVRRAHCLAIEGAEGTAAMLARVSELSATAHERGGSLIKAQKKGQDARLDRPAIGPLTIRSAEQAGLTVIAVEAGGVLLLERDELERRAVAAGITLYGFEA